MLLQEKTDWDSAKKVLTDSNFIKRLIEYDKDNIPDKVLKAIKRLIDDPTFTPDQVAKQSKAAMSMCMWVKAMDTYAKVAKASSCRPVGAIVFAAGPHPTPTCI